jgi:hypothetical protein
MQPYIQLLRQSICEACYTVDERAVADAMLMRARTRLSENRAEVQKHLPWLDLQIRQFDSGNVASAAPAPSGPVLGSDALRASDRRAAVRSLHDDIKARMTEFLAQHPGSTIRELTQSLNLNAMQCIEWGDLSA